MKRFGNEYTGNPIRTHVFKEIEQAILNGELKPGESLTEVKLSNQLGVSRTPVREALMQLELEGLIKNFPGKGAVVVGITHSDINDIYTIRIRVEGLAARRAAENVTDEELAALEEIVELQQFYVNRDDLVQVWQLDRQFHQLLYECCRSRPLKQMLTLFHNYISKARESTVRGGRANASTQEHRAIVNALREHNPDKAEEQLAFHVTNARNSFFANDTDFE